jgi:hypothetical protein
MTIVQNIARKTWEECKQYLKYAYSLNKDSKSNTTLSGKIKGIYIFTEKGVIPDVGCVIYVGETYDKSKYNGINSRIRNHKKSLCYPEWETEKTGKKFLSFNIPLDIEMDLWYINAIDVGINDKQSSRAIEQLIQKHLKPKVWDIE